MNVDKELDVRGLNCPLPVLRTKKALNAIGAGQVLKVTATDPASVRDIEALARQTNNELLRTTDANGEYVFFLRKHGVGTEESGAPEPAVTACCSH